jgi:hypothetical protein
MSAGIRINIFTRIKNIQALIEDKTANMGNFDELEDSSDSESSPAVTCTLSSIFVPGGVNGRKKSHILPG